MGELTLGFTESASFNAVVTELIRQYRQRYPDVEMTLTQGDSETLVAQLREGALDAAFVRPPFALDGGLAFAHLDEEPLMVALPLGHALARRSGWRRPIWRRNASFCIRASPATVSAPTSWRPAVSTVSIP